MYIQRSLQGYSLQWNDRQGRPGHDFRMPELEEVSREMGGGMDDGWQWRSMVYLRSTKTGIQYIILDTLDDPWSLETSSFFHQSQNSNSM